MVTIVTWQSLSSDLTRSQSALISAHWSEITRYLPAPGVAWRWGECGISHRVKYRWKCDGLIYRAPDEERWMTSERLWCAVIEKAGPDETVGAAASGQQTISDAPEQSRLESRTLADSGPDRTPHQETWQATLTAGTADAVELVSDDIAEHITGRTVLKDPTRPSEREIAAHHPSQRKLTAWCAGTVEEEWVGPTSGEMQLLIAQ